MATTVVLPPGWRMDYDHVASKCFFVHEPTGVKQLDFPKPGDEVKQTKQSDDSNTTTASRPTTASEPQSGVIPPNQKQGSTSSSIQESTSPSVAPSIPLTEAVAKPEEQGSVEHQTAIQAKPETECQSSSQGTDSAAGLPGSEPDSLVPATPAHAAAVSEPNNQESVTRKPAKLSMDDSRENSQSTQQESISTPAPHAAGPVPTDLSHLENQAKLPPLIAPVHNLPVQNCVLGHPQQVASAGIPSNAIPVPGSQPYPTYGFPNLQSANQLYGDAAVQNSFPSGLQQLWQGSPQFYLIQDPRTGGLAYVPIVQTPPSSPEARGSQASPFSDNSCQATIIDICRTSGDPNVDLPHELQNTNSTESIQQDSDTRSNIDAGQSSIKSTTDSTSDLDQLSEQLSLSPVQSSSSKYAGALAKLQKKSKKFSKKVMSTANETGNAVRATANKTGSVVMSTATKTQSAVMSTANKTGSVVMSTATKTQSAVMSTTNKTQGAVISTVNKTGNVVMSTANKTGNIMKDALNSPATKSATKSATKFVTGVALEVVGKRFGAAGASALVEHSINNLAENQKKAESEQGNGDAKHGVSQEKNQASNGSPVSVQPTSPQSTSPNQQPATLPQPIQYQQSAVQPQLILATPPASPQQQTPLTQPSMTLPQLTPQDAIAQPQPLPADVQQQSPAPSATAGSTETLPNSGISPPDTVSIPQQSFSGLHLQTNSGGAEILNAQLAQYYAALQQQQALQQVHMPTSVTAQSGGSGPSASQPAQQLRQQSPAPPAAVLQAAPAASGGTVTTSSYSVDIASSTGAVQNSGISPPGTASIPQQSFSGLHLQANSGFADMVQFAQYYAAFQQQQQAMQQSHIPKSDSGGSSAIQPAPQLHQQPTASPQSRNAALPNIADYAAATALTDFVQSNANLSVFSNAAPLGSTADLVENSAASLCSTAELAIENVVASQGPTAEPSILKKMAGTVTTSVIKEGIRELATVGVSSILGVSSFLSN